MKGKKKQDILRGKKAKTKRNMHYGSIYIHSKPDKVNYIFRVIDIDGKIIKDDEIMTKMQFNSVAVGEAVMTQGQTSGQRVAGGLAGSLS